MTPDDVRVIHDLIPISDALMGDFILSREATAQLHEQLSKALLDKSAALAIFEEGATFEPREPVVRPEAKPV